MNISPSSCLPRSREAIRLVISASCLFSLTIISNSVPAADKEPAARSFRDCVCDQAVLSDGTRLSGIVINDPPPRIVVRTEHLRSKSPQLFEKEIQPALTEQDQNNRLQLVRILQTRIDELILADPNDRQQIGLLEETIERLQPQQTALPPWLIIELESHRLKRFETLAANRREIAAFALMNEVPNFEELHWKVVQARLQAIPAGQLKHPTANQTPIPPEVIAERIFAAIDVRLNNVSKLIKTGDSFLNENSKPDMAIVLSSLMGNSLNNTLQELLNETGDATGGSSTQNAQQSTAALTAAAIRMVEKDGHSSVIISSFEFSIENGNAAVTKQLFRKSTTGNWTLITSATQNSSLNDTTAEQVKQIEEDPQIKEIAGLLSQLSPDSGSLTTAFGMGAVVQSALSRADIAFQQSLQETLTDPSANSGSPITVILKTAAK